MTLKRRKISACTLIAALALAGSAGHACGQTGEPSAIRSNEDSTVKNEKDDPEICATVQKLIGFAQGGFSRIKGPTIPGTSISRETKIKFPGSARCEVTELASRTEYTCDWARTDHDKQIIAELAGNIAACLPEATVNLSEINDAKPRATISTRNAEFYLGVDSIDRNVYLTARAL